MKLNLDEDIIVSCYLMGLSERQVFEGNVRSSLVQQKQVQLGIEFANLDNNKVTNISKYIQNVIESAPPKGSDGSGETAAVVQ